MAARCTVSSPTIARLERGDMTVSVAVLVRYLEVLVLWPTTSAALRSATTRAPRSPMCGSAGKLGAESRPVVLPMK